MTDKKIDKPESDVVQTNSPDPETADSAEPESADLTDVQDDKGSGGSADAKPESQRRSISIDVRSLVTGMVIVVLVGAVATLAWLYIGAQRKVETQARELANYARAEKTALDYAGDAAAMDYKDLNAWKVKLVAGTSPELQKKLSTAAASIEQILVPLQWSSTAEPLIAKVRSTTGGIYVVDAFVSVQTKTVQAPDPLQSTATYSVTIDSNKNWQITDVGGIGSAVRPK